MRAALVLAAILVLGACRNNDQADNTQNIDENLTAENIVSNDVTAIDAVTGDAANMAADVDMNFGDLEENVGNDEAPATRPKSPRSSAPASKPRSDEPTTNATTNAE